MRIKFLRTTPSLSPEVPFQAGQIIRLPKLTADVRAWVKAGDAIVLEEDEAAMLGPAVERAVLVGAQPRGAR